MRVKRHLQILTMLAVTTLLATPLTAQTLYGASNGTPGTPGISDLYTIDPATGDATVIGSIGFENVTGMACLPDGRLVATTRGDSLVPVGPATAFIEVDRVTGAGTLIDILYDLGAGDSCGRMPGLTYDEVSGNLFGYGDFCAGGFEGLWTVDPDLGVPSFVGATGYTGGGNGLAAEPGTGALFATPFDNNSLVSIDPVTGMGSDVPGSGGNVPTRVNSLAFHPDGTLYGSLNDPFAGTSSLVTIATSDGTTTIVGQTVLSLDAIVFDCEPAGPDTPIVEIPTVNSVGLAVLALLLAASAWMMMRRRRLE